MSNEPEEFRDVKIRLKGMDLEKFKRVKDAKGLLADAEVLRQLIKEADDALQTPKPAEATAT